MKPSDLAAFGQLLADVHAYYRRDLSDFTRTTFWGALQDHDLEQVARAFSAHAKDPEHGRYCPMVSDLVRIMQGTHTDRAQLAWGRMLEAMRSVGQYTDVIFEDAATHAAIEDLGGWPKLCCTEIAELSYLQIAFAKSHKAYVGRGKFPYQRMLSGNRSPDDVYAKSGLPPPKPALIGDPKRCALVYNGGEATGKTSIRFASLGALAALALPKRTAINDEFVRDDVPHGEPKRIGGKS